VESLTAIIEHHDGRMELVRYRDFIARQEAVYQKPAGDRRLARAV
jgi:hypothetical protein